MRTVPSQWSLNKAREINMPIESENFFADFPREGGETLEEALNSVDKEIQDEKPAESQTEKETVKEEAPDLSKNEAWKKIREERDAERQAREDAEARLAKIEQEKEADKPREQSAFLTTLVGENEEASRVWEQEKRLLIEQAKREMSEEQEAALRKESEQKQYWTKWTSERLAEVETEFNVNFSADESMKNELSKIMLEYSPTDEKGNLDYRKGMKILNNLKGVEKKEEEQKTQVKKNVADATISKDKGVAKDGRDYVTRADLKKSGWRGL